MTDTVEQAVTEVKAEAQAVETKVEAVSNTVVTGQVAGVSYRKILAGVVIVLGVSFVLLHHFGVL